MLRLKGSPAVLKQPAALVTRFIKLERQDPYRLFASSLDAARLGMSNAYYAAFESYVRCSDLLKEHEWSQIDTDDLFEQLGLYDSRLRRPTASQEELQRMYADAQAEDLQADYLAGILLLFADDTLQRFAKGVLGVAPGLGPGYGAEFGTHRGKVRLTALLRAGTNAIRHISEWDDYRWEIEHPGKVYPTLPECKNDYERQIMKNIVVFQNVLGWGLNERIRDVQSMRILIQIDGRLGSDPPDYDRFEQALSATAHEIARAKDENAVARLEAELGQ